MKQIKNRFLRWLLRMPKDRDDLGRRWLCGHQYTLIRGTSDGRYQWLTDSGVRVGPSYGSLEMAEYHFGEGFNS